MRGGRRIGQQYHHHDRKISSKTHSRAKLWHHILKNDFRTIDGVVVECRIAFLWINLHIFDRNGVGFKTSAHARGERARK